MIKNSIVLSEVLKNSVDNIYKLNIDNTLNQYYVIEEYFSNNHVCDYLREPIIVLDKSSNGSLIVSRIIEIVNNEIIISDDEFEIRNVNNKYYKFENNSYGNELHIHKINKHQLTNDHNVRRTFVEESFYIEKDGRYVANMNYEYTEPCNF